MKATVAITRCQNYEPAAVQEAIGRAVGLLGGISAFIKPASKVLVKPNLLLAVEPEKGVDTHPEVVRAVIKLLRGIGCKVMIGDGPSAFGGHFRNVAHVYEKSGMSRIAEEEGAELVIFDKRRWHGEYCLTALLDECDHLVSIPKFKTHELMILTAAIKNLYGLVIGTYKAELHSKYFQVDEFARVLADIYQKTKPSLTVIDGITAMEGDGPGTGGTLRQQGILLAGNDGVALDSVLALIMGLEPRDIPTTKEAAARGLGTAERDSIEILGEDLKNIITGPFVLPKSAWTRKLPLPLVRILKKFKLFYPKVVRGTCIRCGACVRACPRHVISMKPGGIAIDYSGCISCFCCQETCPASAINVQKSLFAKAIGM